MSHCFSLFFQLRLTFSVDVCILTKKTVYTLVPDIYIILLSRLINTLPVTLNPFLDFGPGDLKVISLLSLS